MNKFKRTTKHESFFSKLHSDIWAPSQAAGNGDRVSRRLKLIQALVLIFIMRGGYYGYYWVLGDAFHYTK